MAFFENGVERATALAATCGWLAFGGGAEAAVGVAIGGAGLAAVVSDAIRRHGPESEAALKSIRKRIAADLAAHAKVERWDTRADLEAADASMERALAGCFLDRKALAASARSPEGLPSSATKLILARLAEREPATFGQDGPRAARDFADLVVRTALEAAIENESYFKNLQPHLLMETLRGLGAVEEKIDTGFRKIHDTTGETHELVREIRGRIVGDTMQGVPDVRSISDLAHPSMTAHSGQVLSMVFFKSGERLATLGADNNISVWDTSEGNQLASVTVGGPATSGCLAAFPSSDEFCSSDHDAGTHFWNENCDPVYVNGFKALGPPSAKAIVFSPDGKKFAWPAPIGWPGSDLMHGRLRGHG